MATDIWVALEVIGWSTHVKVNKTGKARGCRHKFLWFLHGCTEEVPTRTVIGTLE